MTAFSSIRFPLTTIAAAVVALTLAGCGGGSESSDGGASPTAAAEPTVIRFGIISTDSSSGLMKGFEPFLEDMSKELGVEVKAFFAPTYAGIIEGMRFDQVEVAWLGNKSALEAVDRAGGEVFAQTVAADGSPGYWSILIVRKDAKYKTVDDIIAHGDELTFGNGDPNSTSGYLIPTHYIWSARGIDPRTHFKRVVNANHGANMLAVANGQIDFATNNTENLAMVRDAQPAMYEKIEVIWKSPMIALDPIVWRKNLPDATKQKIRDFMLTYGTGEGPEAERQRTVLANVSSGWAPFRPSTNGQLLPIREIEIAKQINEAEADASLSADQKRAKIDGLKAQLEKLRASQEPAANGEAADAS